MYNGDSHILVSNFSDSISSYFLSNNLSRLCLLDFGMFFNYLLNNSLKYYIFFDYFIIGGWGDNSLRYDFSNGCEGLTFNNLLWHWAFGNHRNFFCILVGDSNYCVILSFAGLDYHNCVNVVPWSLSDCWNYFGCRLEGSSCCQFFHYILNDFILLDDYLIVCYFNLRTCHCVEFVWSCARHLSRRMLWSWFRHHLSVANNCHLPCIQSVSTSVNANRSS